jgi:hypothetical protein
MQKVTFFIEVFFMTANSVFKPGKGEVALKVLFGERGYKSIRL